MKKQLHKIKIAAENFSQRSSVKPERNDELQHIEKQVDKYRDVLQLVTKKISTNAPSGQDQAAKEKRIRKVNEYVLGQALEDSAKELPDGLLKTILEDCAKVEKTIASEIVNNEVNIENDVNKKLNGIIEQQIQVIKKQRSVVAKCHQDNETAKQKHQSAIRLNENQTKINQLKDDQEECETRLEKERDIYASNMFDLLAEEDNISNYILNYVKYQQLFYKSALKEIETLMSDMNGLIRSSNKRVFNTSLQDHLDTTNRRISYVIELCVCCLLEKGLYEEGILRVGCGKSKLMRMRSAIDANFVAPPVPHEYQDPHVIASVLKSYLRSLPEPLLTYSFYQEFIDASQIQNDQQRKAFILNIINKLPEGNYNNLKYLMKFLTLLSEKNQHNKMSTQNIAIVMSPNLLWPQNENDQNYAQQVTSTSAVNTVVETLIGDWNFFFEGDVNFYETMTRDELFPDNGGFSTDKGISMLHAKHDQMSTSMFVGENVKNGPSASKMSHSRSSSHDTSLILLNDPPLKSSQSNSSLSDTSPTTGSPKLVSRRKPKAPIPPAMTPQPGKSKSDIKPPMSMPKSLDTSNFSYIDSDPSLHIDEGKGSVSMRRAGSTENILGTKPSRPPPVARPVANAESQTNSRAVVRQVPLKDKSSSSSLSSASSRPVAAPRTTTLVKGELQKSEENLLVTMREKPAIPDRPVTLMRPASFRAATGGGNGSPTSILNNEKLVEELSAQFTNKASVATVRRNNSLREGRTSESNGNDVQSKQVTMYRTEEKQQVSIIDVPVSSSPRPVRRELFTAENDNKENLRSSQDALNSSDEQKVPPSPRDNKNLKRPQVPPPARPRSSEGDSTNL